MVHGKGLILFFWEIQVSKSVSYLNVDLSLYDFFTKLWVFFPEHNTEILSTYEMLLCIFSSTFPCPLTFNNPMYYCS